MAFKLLFSGDDFRRIDGNLAGIEKIIASEVTGRGAEAMANVTAQEARSIVRVDTGKTRQSIRVVEGRNTTRGKPFYVIAGSQEHRAALFLELGTVKMQPYPFLRPALQRAQKRSFRRFIEAAKIGFRNTTRRIFGRR